MFVNVLLWEHCTLDRFADVAKFTILTLLSVLISCRLSLLMVSKYFVSLLFH
jgi:hypothetical protein